MGVSDDYPALQLCLRSEFAVVTVCAFITAVLIAHTTVQSLASYTV